MGLNEAVFLEQIMRTLKSIDAKLETLLLSSSGGATTLSGYDSKEIKNDVWKIKQNFVRPNMKSVTK